MLLAQIKAKLGEDQTNYFASLSEFERGATCC